MKTYKEMPKQYVGFITDHSASMYSLKGPARKDYNSNITVLKEETNKHELDTIIFSVLCGSGNGNWLTPGSLVERGVVNSTVNLLKPLTEYTTEGDGTPLYDSIGELITLMESVPDVDSPNVSFLLIVITDGLENASNTWNAYKLKTKLDLLHRTDRWTFTFRTPKGSAAVLQGKLGIPIGNFYEWDTTKEGLELSHKATTKAVKSYYTQRAAGISSTQSFYTDLSKVTSADVKSVLDDITNEVTAFTITTKYHDAQIRDFIISRKKGPFNIGCGFYELTKREKVQSYKQVVIKDLRSNKFYGGQAARDLIGLSDQATNVNPGDHSHYKIFVQSTSVNRKVKQNTQLVYWPNVLNKTSKQLPLGY